MREGLSRPSFFPVTGNKTAPVLCRFRYLALYANTTFGGKKMDLQFKAADGSKRYKITKIYVPEGGSFQAGAPL